MHAHAMTLGHVVLGRDADCLERTRAHERVHVRQTEQFGALFPFAYMASSAWALLRGRHYSVTTGSSGTRAGARDGSLTDRLEGPGARSRPSAGYTRTLAIRHTIDLLSSFRILPRVLDLEAYVRGYENFVLVAGRSVGISRAKPLAS